MGGLGSGRPNGFGRDTVESCRSIDVNRLHKTGCLVPGWRGGWEWKRDGVRVAWINLRTEDDYLHLSYRARIGGGDWEDVEETVDFYRRLGLEIAYEAGRGGAGQRPAIRINDRDRFRAACPHVAFDATPGVGHFHQLLAPDEINAKIERFVAEIDPAAA